MSIAADQVRRLIDEVLPHVVALRHELHANPELSFQEKETARRVAAALASIPGLHIADGVAGTGVVALLNHGQPGPCVALRAELDALPITEETGLPYASRNPGMMHACGHDGHAAILVATAGVLSRLRDNLPGCVKFIFQPAEEEGAGANEMCKAGVLDDPPVNAIFALHGWPQGKLGRVAVCPGPATASTDTIHLTVRGRGAHGGQPHQGIDPIMVSAKIIDGLQTIASRSVPPTDAVVVTIGSIHGGTAVNVIPPSVQMSGTIRTLSEEIRRRVRDLAEQIIRNTAAAFGAEVDLELRRGYPVTVNDPALSEFVLDTATDVLGADQVIRDRPTTGAEDFAYYTRRVPGTIFRLGVCPPNRDAYPGVHQPHYDFNDGAIPVGIQMLAELTRRYLATKGT